MPFNKVGTKGIADGSVATAEFADGVVTSAKLQDGSVTNDKLTNTTVTVSGTSITLGDSVTFANKFVNWQSVITADGSTSTTGVAGRGYFINTTSAAHTFTLPSSATRGDTIAIKDYAGTFATYNLTIARNGHNIQGVANNSLISTNRASVVLVYVDVTRGWEFVEESNVAVLVPTFITATGGTITTSGNFKIHTFTGDGCFVVSTIGNPLAGPSATLVDYLVVAGGGGGGYGDYSGGGGGAGGYRTTFPSPGCNAGSFPISATTYPITVGGGGAGGSLPSTQAVNGSPSIFSTITSTGGGAGGDADAPVAAGDSGGSGGGGACAVFSQKAGGTGNSPPVSPPQGNPGGTSAGYPPSNFSAGGGGGASAAGVPGTPGNTGAGGAGSANSITDSSVSYGGGGGGGNAYPGCATSHTGAGGTGGGGIGATPARSFGAGTVNTGGGGGGGVTTPGTGGAGGKGIVIIRYKYQ